MSEPHASAPAAVTLGALLREATAALQEAGIERAADEARRLVAFAAGLSTLVVATEPDRRLTPQQMRAVADALSRRARHEPLSRIAGRREFYGRDFRLSAATLDPRPDSETLIEAALELVRAEGWSERPIRILDIGTGSGCLLLTLVAELPLATGLGTDIAPDALATAAANARDLGLDGRVGFARARSLDGIAGTFDLVVSNPPYIPTGDIAGLDRDVRLYDPIAALDGGPDGLAVYREIAGRLPAVCPRGWAVLEVGAGQADDVQALLASAEWPNAPTPRSWMDLNGHTRVVAVGTH